MKRQKMVPSMLRAGVVALSLWGAGARADETCLSPYTAALIRGQEKYLQVWTLGVKGMGDESDKLVTVNVDPKSPDYGKVVATLSVGGRGEAHHMGFTDDRKYLWAGRLDDNKIFVFDVGTDPGKPKLVKTIDDLVPKSGFVGPHTFYALPGRMIVGALSNAKDHGGATGLAVYSNAGEFLSAHPLPTTDGGDGYGYDIGINPQKNAMLTSSFTGWNNYMMDFGKLVADPAAMKNFGATMVMWNLKSMQPDKVFSVPGAPLEIRWSLKDGDDWAITATALTSQLWLVKKDDKGAWVAKDVAAIGDPAKIPLPVDISIAADGKSLWVNTFMDGMTRLFDLNNPEQPKEIYSKHTGSQVNMVSQSWDGKRVYVTTSLLANWDKKGADDEQFLKAFDWNGKELTEKFKIDFYGLKLGRAHHMKFTGEAQKAASVAPTRL
ncbi:MAG: selenium-binding protein [Hyphomicrobiales bacterium]|nr:selenium-binding protein [Hyphomicrobiales bacterium]